MLRFRLMREIGRQAVLIAARDELGLLTRDETLDEVFPDSVKQAKHDVFVAVRSQFNGDVHIQVWTAAEPQQVEPIKKTNKYVVNSIQNQTTSAEKMIRGELREKLRNLGFEGKPLPRNEQNVPPHDIENHLLDMNYVSQFGAVRTAHAAIKQKGESRGWLGVLARGYANLALTTEHHWKSDTDVFAARALLYAQRLVSSSPDDLVAHANRAYVLALVGLHGAALEELERVKKLQTEHEQETLPGWLEVVKPYCTFERRALVDLVSQRPTLSQLAQRLSFEQNRAFNDGLFESGRQTITNCPEDYSVYAALTLGSPPLATGRMGAYYAPAALVRFLPQRIAELDDLPRTLREGGVGVAKKEKSDNAKSIDPPPAQPIESAPNFASGIPAIIDALRAATRAGDDRAEPSWSALGELIFEEQFVQAANYLHISMNATESSHDDEVNAVLPTVKGHRYARFIESYRVNVSREPERLKEIVGDIAVVDPRGNMWPMMLRIWQIDCTPKSSGRGSGAAWSAFIDRGVTFNGMIEAWESCGDALWSHVEPATHTRWSNDFHALSPRSPEALRFAMALVDKPSYEQAKQWEAHAGEDAVAYSSLGDVFTELKQFDDAIRVYERSVGLSPSKAAYVGLANAYRAAGQEDMWLPTLERFFQIEMPGLEHASVHQLIANDLIDKGELEAARPHAVAAAETWSGWGLQLASRVDEALGRWEDSERWISEATKNYPTYCGDDWYFWCRRTGRGDALQARKFAEIYFQDESIKSSASGQSILMTFRLLENDPKAAYEHAKKAEELARAEHQTDDYLAFEVLHVALLAREIKDNDGAAAAIAKVRQLSENVRQQYGPFCEVNLAVCDVLDGKELSQDAAAKVERQIENDLNKTSRCNYEYFLGRAYDLAGKTVEAKSYWSRCVSHGPFDRYNVTLAGKYLADRSESKTSRP